MDVICHAVLLKTAAAALALNLPFGYWRAGVPKFSLGWFLAIHLPVPAVVALRLFCGLGWQPLTVAVLLTSCFLGQLLGGRLR